ncbi:mechanosensitive ion channel family protein [Salinicola corii]|uniref:Mechanosensitive ion channel family protein n=1 Tax=Salinicola corii TaxID=2606937 RepID=A0A640WIJ5_9GAMM|nr:mechanosensitive ion channel family protein [Salinicola corii]KAA0020405.1 mechanosensitive ion channel family protein [Salinicola corii]
MEIPDRATTLLSQSQEALGQWLHIPGWIVLPALILLVAFLIDLTLYFTLSRMERRLRDSPRRWDDPILHGLRLPLRWWVWITALMVDLGIIGTHFEIERLTTLFSRLGALITLLLVAWGGIRLFRRLEQRLVFPPVKCHAKPVDPTSASALTKIVGAVLIVTLLLIGLQILGVSMSSILAMGGFGGLVIGFAARDVIANFFGGMVVHLDKPFVVGDWIRSPERQIEGIVEDIGWRLTTVRTFAGPPLYVPNAWFSQISVETPTRMVSRRLWETIGIRYQDIDKIENITHDIRDLLQQHEEINQDELITVNFVTYGQYSLDIMIYAFTLETDWQRFHEIKQAILLKIRDIIDQHGARLAIPTSRLYLPEGLDREDGERDGTQVDRERKSGDSDDSAPRSSRGKRQHSRAPGSTDDSRGEGDA